MKALKALIQPFEAPQQSVKKSFFNVIFILIQLLVMHGTLRVKL